MSRLGYLSLTSPTHGEGSSHFRILCQAFSHLDKYLTEQLPAHLTAAMHQSRALPPGSAFSYPEVCTVSEFLSPIKFAVKIEHQLSKLSSNLSFPAFTKGDYGCENLLYARKVTETKHYMAKLKNRNRKRGLSQ